MADDALLLVFSTELGMAQLILLFQFGTERGTSWYNSIRVESQSERARSAACRDAPYALLEQGKLYFRVTIIYDDCPNIQEECIQYYTQNENYYYR
jgi:hypothetical protein